MHKPIIDNSVTIRSKQNLSCNWTGSADFGRLVPIHWEELYPGDHVITCKPRMEMQMLPFASPTFGKIDCYIHYFVVPLRLLNDTFYEKWSRVGVNKDLDFPWFSARSMRQMYLSNGEDTAKRRAFYKHWTSLGMNPFFASNYYQHIQTPFTYFPFAAYNQIWWDFYRDPEVVRDESKSEYLYTGEINGDTPNISDFEGKYMRPHVRSIKNNWISDLFAQQGDLFGAEYNDPPFVNEPLNYNNVAGVAAHLSPSGMQNQVVDSSVDESFPANETARMNRLIESLTRLAERLSLSGKRQIEALYARYGVKPKWSEMNLCRYVGGGKSEVLVDSIISTSDTADGISGSPLGAKAGNGYCALDSINIECSVDEPSILMGILSVMPHVHFVQGISKKWQRRTLTDFFQPSLQYVGQVAVSKQEVAHRYELSPDYNENKNGDIFAFCDPYYEYKQGLDILAGDFMLYHNAQVGDGEHEDDYLDRDIRYMQSMEQYIDFPVSREFNMNNLLVDGDAFNKIFSYLGGGVDEDKDDHFHICINKEVIIDRPMEGYPVPTLETTQDPHKKTTVLSGDKML